MMQETVLHVCIWTLMLCITFKSIGQSFPAFSCFRWRQLLHIYDAKQHGASEDAAWDAQAEGRSLSFVESTKLQAIVTIAAY